MRQNTELSAMPPVFSVEQENGMAIITFYTDVQPVERESGTAYQAVAWSMRCPWQDNLPARVEANTDLWLAKIKGITRVEEAREELEQMNQTAVERAVCELADIVAELMEAVAELAEMV